MQEQVDERVSARFEKELLDQVDAVVQSRGYINRSEFLRVAVRSLINCQQQENTVAVKVPALMRQFLEMMVDKGLYSSPEEAILDALSHYFTKERIEEAVKKLDLLEVATGKKADVKVDDASRQIVSQK
jgi:Arc/MetJ-type ribon-helix-helix transcriptional regulator